MITLIYERNKVIGNGHFMRCSSLNDTFHKGYGLDSRLVNENEFIAIGGEGEIFVLDFSSIEKCTDLMSKLSKKNLIITFDYFSNDAQPDFNVSVFEHFRGKRTHYNYVGLTYSIIRNDFFEYEQKTIKKDKNVFIYIGGSGYKELINDIVDKLSDSNYKINLIRNNNSDQLDEMPENVTVYHSPENLKEIMENSYFAITSPGLTTMELLYLKVPSVLCPLNSLHEIFSDFFVENDYALCKFSEFDSVKEERIEKVLQATENVIDGKGQNRIIQLILDQYERKMGSSYPMWK